MVVKHKKVSMVPDGPDTSLVRPSDWNAGHTGISGEVHIPLIVLADEKTF